MVRTVHAQRDTSGRYEIRLIEPGSWELIVDGVRRSMFGTASAARSAAARVESFRRLRLILVRNGAVIAFIGLGIVLATAFRTVINPDYSPARNFADRMEAAYLAVVAGEEDLSGVRLESHGFAGAAVDGPPVFAIATGEPTNGPAPPVRTSMLVGELSGTCYGLLWEETERPVTVIVRPEFPCSPYPDVARSSSHVRSASSSERGVVDWDPIIPVPQIQAGWFLPVVLAFFGSGLWSAIGITLALLRYRSGRGTSLIWDD